mmetsp:Transcript_1612/g.2392  ORF Transcript_1612/g.2392 Transcript_1612/m.2392 type:complete len:200 (-) Transcript_1612:56-655(-)
MRWAFAFAACVIADDEHRELQSAAVWKATFSVEDLTGQKAGSFTIDVHPDWAPLGAARFKELVEAKYFDQSCFFRAVPNFVAQFGLAADPKTTAEWRDKDLKDDPVKTSNTAGRLTFATAGPNTRTTQMFLNFKDNTFLDSQGFAPFGEVSAGMDIVSAIYTGYGEKPSQGQITSQGKAYLDKNFPKLTCIKAVSLDIV